MITTLRAVATCLYIYVGRFKTFGIWWKMSEYIIGSAKLAFCYIDQLGQVDEILEYEENWPKKLQVSE